MTQNGQAVTAPPIQALIIRPDSTYEIRHIGQEAAVLRDLLDAQDFEEAGDYTVTFWVDRDAEDRGLPFNPMATFLYWKLFPEVEAQEALRGVVVVTGGADEAGDSEPVPNHVIETYRDMEGIRLRHEASKGEPAP